MPESVTSIGRLLIFVGLGIVVLGGLLLLLGKVPFFGNLPGDINYEGPKGRVTVFAPFGTMIVFSIILTIVVNVVIRLLNR